VIHGVCLRYASDCTVKSAGKPPQPIEKTTAGPSLLAQVIVSKFADHQPLHGQEKMFERHGVEISRKTMGGWLAQCAELLDPLHRSMKEGTVWVQGNWHRRHRCKSARFANFRSPGSGGSGLTSEILHHPVTCTTTRRREDERVRRSSWKDTKDICRRTPTPFTMHSSNPNAG
jgi:hypothetical protein